jgi:23S rRNA (cytosine1962-C5)-methyltransferase
LNLFCYTGAFSLWALKHGASFCCSLDSSYKYLNILKSNLAENNIPEVKHKIMESDFFKGIYHFQEKRNQFDLIILDPPSSFTSQQKKVQAFQIYPEMLKQISKIASSKAYLLCFLNHHQKTRNQFETMVAASLPQWSIVKQLHLSDDAPLLSYFPEGDYLKGLLLQKK